MKNKKNLNLIKKINSIQNEIFINFDESYFFTLVEKDELSIALYHKFPVSNFFYKGYDLSINLYSNLKGLKGAYIFFYELENILNTEHEINQILAKLFKNNIQEGAK